MRRLHFTSAQCGRAADCGGHAGANGSHSRSCVGRASCTRRRSISRFIAHIFLPSRVRRGRKAVRHLSRRTFCALAAASARGSMGRAAGCDGEVVGAMATRPSSDVA
jgi:hypothetical protein